MIQPVIDLAKAFVEDKRFKRVLEVGSRDVDTGTIKPVFLKKCDEYIGLDLEKGKEVDIVADAEDLLKFFKPQSFDCVVCVETLEHVKNPIKIVENMRKVLKRGGWLFITTPGIGHPEHNWPGDYYRYFESTYKEVFFKDYVNCHFQTRTWEGKNPQFPDAIFGYGQKP